MYKGPIITEKKANDLNIKKRKEKLNYALPLALRFSNQVNVATEYIRICLKLIESTLIPMVLANSEIWKNPSKRKVYKNWTIYRRTCLHHFFNTYWSLLNETGLPTMERRIDKRILLLLEG